MANLIQKYGIAVDQKYISVEGYTVTVVDVTTYADCDDVVVRNDKGEERRIDAFKLAMVRYALVS